MRVTYAEFLRMRPEAQARVTHLDMSDDEYLPRKRGDAEEWPGEAIVTGLPPQAGGGE